MSHIIEQFPKNIHKTILQTIYGCGLRLSEVLKLRIKDLDFDYNRMIIWNSKSLNDRSLPLPQKLIENYKKMIAVNREQHKKDLAGGFGTVQMPNALARKYPNANKEFKWQYLFTMNKVSKVVSRTGILDIYFNYHTYYGTLALKCLIFKQGCD